MPPARQGNDDASSAGVGRFDLAVVPADDRPTTFVAEELGLPVVAGRITEEVGEIRP